MATETCCKLPNGNAEAEKFLNLKFADDPSLDFARKELVRSVAAMVHGAGFRSARCRAILVLSDLLEEYMRQMFVKALSYAEIGNRSTVSVEDTIQVCRELQVDTDDLIRFANCPNPVPLPSKAVPHFPVKPESITGWSSDIPRCFHDEVPMKEEVEAEARRRLLEGARTDSTIELEPSEPKQSKGRRTSEFKSDLSSLPTEFPNFANMPVRALGFFKPEKLIIRIKRSVLDRAESSNTTANKTSRTLQESMSSATSSCSDVEMARHADSDADMSEMDGAEGADRTLPITEISRHELSHGSPSSSITTEKRIPLGADELCMVITEISTRTGLPNIVIRINRALMEEHVRKAKESNTTPPPVRTRKRQKGRPRKRPSPKRAAYDRDL
ncbi:hypothetical protein QR680_018541 [Steinernema hermaphroditum]|uniref:Bromodomain associated domain-containing protein n=1 Tax=Steinernema hermaphroditum TaxID=289476 RepID=A0AA39LQH4_9BILA|nr:hypothetical protein QR680_018541 [Steinernema hermaphroditum]